MKGMDDELSDGQRAKKLIEFKHDVKTKGSDFGAPGLDDDNWNIGGKSKENDMGFGLGSMEDDENSSSSPFNNSGSSGGGFRLGGGLNNNNQSGGFSLGGSSGGSSGGFGLGGSPGGSSGGFGLGSGGSSGGFGGNGLSGGFGSTGFGGNSGSSLNNVLNGGGGYTSFNQQQNQQMQQQKQKGMQLEDLLVSIWMAIWSFIKAVVHSLQNNSKADWHRLGVRITKVSLVFISVGLLFSIMGLIVKTVHGGINVMIGSILGLMTGITLSFTFDLNDDSGDEMTIQDINDNEDTNSDFTNPFNSSDVTANTNTTSTPSSSFNWDEDDEDDSTSFNWDDDEEDDEIHASDYIQADVSDRRDFTPEEVSDSLKEYEGKGSLITRKILYDTIMDKVLKPINPTFDTFYEIDTESDEGEKIVSNFNTACSSICGSKAEDIVISSIEKNTFVLRLIAEKPEGINSKEKDIATEFVNLYKNDKYGDPIDGLEDVQAVLKSQGSSLIIVVLLGNASSKVGLYDIMDKNKDHFLNTKYIAPVVWGINESGKPALCDIVGGDVGNGSLLLSGQGRSGKSWKGQSLIAQMCSFMSPKELNFYVFDPKERSSDYFSICKYLPHFKKFYSNPLTFVSRLKGLLDEEVDRRRKILASAGEGIINIKDYNNANIENKIPYMYLLFDEMASAYTTMSSDKNLVNEYFGLLKKIVTEYPNLGIRCIFFPHRVINTIIDKTVSMQVSTRAVFMSSKDLVKETLNVSDKDFPYILNTTGDMGILSPMVGKGKVTYLHAEVITNGGNKENLQVFKNIGAIWKLLEKVECDCDRYDRDDHLLDADGNVVSGKKFSSNTESKPIEAPDRSFTNIGSDDDDSANNVDESFWNDELSDDSQANASEETDDELGEDFWGDKGNDEDDINTDNDRENDAFWDDI